MRPAVVVATLLLVACGRTDLVPPAPVVEPPPPNRCGDGLVADGEACDDANTDDTDACRNDCTRATCGDGVTWRGVEHCDDGAQGSMTCSTSCGPSSCGDGVTQPPEQCDDGNRLEDDACLNSCLPASCGDGRVRQGLEACDDANQANDDECVACRLARCGDGFVRRGFEECDDGNQDEGDACRSSCVPARCGDAVIQRGVEACDDGNTDDEDACVSCAFARCGDGKVQRGVEACDDGNDATGDACIACAPARCGDGFVQAGVEQCDDGNTVDDDFCDNACKTPVCGDGKRAGSEACDLGALNGDTPAFRITQPSGTRIGTDAIVRPRTIQQFYDYRSASSHTGLEVVGESRIYLFADANTGRLSLVLTHGIDFDGTGQVQAQSEVEMDITGLPTGTGVDVADDAPSEFFLGPNGTAFGRWSFNRNSDGGALGPLAFPGRWRITVTPRFQTGITTWGWVKDDGTRIPLNRTEPITIEALDTATNCRTDCTAPRCGDRRFDAGEVCDDGNNVDGDGCSADCRRLR